MKFWRADFAKYVLTIFLLLWPLAIQFGTKLVLTLHVAISANGSKSGRHDGGLMPFRRQLNLLLWCKVILNSDELIMKNVTSNIMPYMRLATKLWSLLLKCIFIHWVTTWFRAARWGTNISGMEKLFSIDWDNIMQFWRAVFEKSILTIFVLLWPLAIHFSAKHVLTLHVAISANKSKSGWHDGGLMSFHRQFTLLLWCKVILNSDEPIMKSVISKCSCHICGLRQNLWCLLLKYYIH